MTIGHLRKEHEVDANMTPTKRAYTEEAKQQREEMIIAAAAALLMEKGYYAINVEQVAQSAGLAKGTVYLYFKTKEALFLTVFERQATVWFNEIEQELSLTPEGSPKQTLVDLLVKSLIHKPLLTRLVALTSIIFEYNVSVERAHQHKVWIFDYLAAIGQLLETKFDLRPMQGLRFLLRAFVIVAGLEGFAHPSPITDQVFALDPTLTKLDFESELRSLLSLLLKANSA
jgi:AcrR family transcriptional regulator